MKITPYTNAIIINGEVHKFKKSKKEVTCDECSLRRKVMYAEHCEFKDVCNVFRHNWSEYEFGAFEKEK